MPNRMLRERALTSKRLGAVSAEAEALYYRLMLKADDHGRYFGEPALIQSACYPRGERQIEVPLEELVGVGLIHPYEIDGDPYVVFDRWDQQVRAKESRFPQPPTDVRTRAHVLTDAPLDVDEVEVVDVKDFIDFWETYPRKVGKRAARAAFEKALKRALVDEIVAGAKRYALDPNRDGQFTAHPTTWLNRDGWEDDPLPAKGTGPAPAEADREYFVAREVDEEAVAEFAAAAAANPPSWSKRKDLA